MYLQSNETKDFYLESNTGLQVYIKQNTEVNSPNWFVEVLKNSRAVKFIGGFYSEEGARQEANSFIKESADIFDISWVKKTQMKVKLNERIKKFPEAKKLLDELLK